MNRYALAWGAILALSGVVMHLLLNGLREQTFRLSLFNWQTISFGVIAAGIILAIFGLVSDRPRYAGISSDTAAKYFAWAALVNAVVAAVITAGMLIPPLEFPILFTEWPGIYIFIGYASFILFGVIGMLAWGTLFYLAPKFFSRQLLDRRSFILHLFLSEVGVYVASSVLFYAGFLGATYAHMGFGAVVVGISIEFADVPAAIGVFIVIVSVFLEHSTSCQPSGLHPSAVVIRPEQHRQKCSRGQGNERDEALSVLPTLRWKRLSFSSEYSI